MSLIVTLRVRLYVSLTKTLPRLRLLNRLSKSTESCSVATCLHDPPPSALLDRLSDDDHDRQHHVADVSVDLPLGGGDVRLPDRGRGRRRRARPQHLGPLLCEAGQCAQRRERRPGVRLLPPLPRGHRARPRARRQRASALDLVAARPAGWSRARERRRAGLLRPRRRRAARERDRAAGDAVPLGSAGCARGRGRLARARDRRGLRRVRAGRRRTPRRPGAPLDHAQRALGDRLARLRLRRPRTGADVRDRRDRSRPPRPSRPRPRH